MIPAYAQGMHPALILILNELATIRHEDQSLNCTGNEEPVEVLRRLRERKNELQIENGKLRAELKLMKLAPQKVEVFIAGNEQEAQALAGIASTAIAAKPSPNVHVTLRNDSPNPPGKSAVKNSIKF